MIRNGYHGKELAALSDRRACVGVCAFFLVGVACTEQVSWILVHMQVYMLWQVSVDTSLRICKHTLHKVCTCALHSVCALCSLASGDEGAGVQLVYAGHLFQFWRRAWFLTWGKMELLSMFSLFFDRGASICGCMRVGTQMWGKNPDQLKHFLHMGRMCVQSTLLSIYSALRDDDLG